MVFLVAQNGRFPWFDEVTRHFESVVSEIAHREVPPELWVITGNEGRFEHLGRGSNLAGGYFISPFRRLSIFRKPPNAVGDEPNNPGQVTLPVGCGFIGVCVTVAGKYHKMAPRDMR